MPSGSMRYSQRKCVGVSAPLAEKFRARIRSETNRRTRDGLRFTSRIIRYRDPLKSENSGDATPFATGSKVPARYARRLAFWWHTPLAPRRTNANKSEYECFNESKQSTLGKRRFHTDRRHDA